MKISQNNIFILSIIVVDIDRLCGLEFLATDTEVPGSIPGTARFFWVVAGLERGLLSLVSLLRSIEELLE